MSIDEGGEYYVSSSYFSNLSDAEKARVVKYLGASEAEQSWGVGMEFMDDGFFAVEAPTDFVPISKTDEYVLSGAAGAEVCETLKEYGKKVPELSLSTLQLLGARALNKESEMLIGDTVTIGAESPTAVTIGADLHGDFRLLFSQSNGNQAIAPDGTKLPFAPAEVEQLSGYHSVEPEIVNTLVEHLAIEYTAKEKAHLFNQIMDGIIAKLKRETRKCSKKLQPILFQPVC